MTKKKNKATRIEPAELTPKLDAPKTPDAPPAVAKRKPAKKATAKKTSNGRIAPEALVPKLDVPAVEKLYWYHVGLVAEAPRGSIDVCGISFPKSTETVRVVEGRTVRVPKLGSIVRLSRAKVEAIAFALARKVVRTVGRPEPRSGVDVGRKYRRPTPVAILSIPGPGDRERAEAAAKEERRRFVWREFIARESDRPLADFIYCVYLGGTKCKPRSIDSEIPPPVSKTGIRLPPPDGECAPDGLYVDRDDAPDLAPAGGTSDDVSTFERHQVPGFVGPLDRATAADDILG